MTNVDPTTQKVIDVVNEIANDPKVAVTISRVTPKISSKARDVLYTIGIVLGLVGTAAAPIAAALTGNAAIAFASIGAASTALYTLLAKFNLSKPIEDAGALTP